MKGLMCLQKSTNKVVDLCSRQLLNMDDQNWLPWPFALPLDRFGEWCPS